MFQLVNQGILTSEFVQLKTYSSLCASCIYDQPWRTCGKKLDIRLNTNNNPGKGMYTDQLFSGQTGLIPQIGVYLNAARILSDNVFVNHFSDLV